MNTTGTKQLQSEEEITIFDQEGRALVNRLPKDVNVDETGKKYAELGSQLLTNIEPVLTSAHLAGVESVLIQSENNQLCILSSEKGKLFITLVGKI